MPEELNKWESTILQETSLKRLSSLQSLSISLKQSAIPVHLFQCNYTINFDNIDILAANSKKFKLFLREKLLIKLRKPILSKTIKLSPLELLD